MAFRAPGEDEFTGTKFLPAAADTYRVVVDSYRVLTGEAAKGQYNPEGNERVRFYLSPLSIEGDAEAELLDIKDQPLPEDKRFTFFYNPDSLGLKPRIAQSRKFMAAVLGVPVTQPIEYDTREAFYEDALGRELIVDVIVKGEYNNITDTRPLPRRTRKRVARDEPLVAVAEKVFAEEAVSAPEAEESY